MDKPRLTESFSMYPNEAAGGGNVALGLTNLSKAVMYAADVLAEAIAQRDAGNRMMQKGTD